MKNNNRFYWFMPLCFAGAVAQAEPLEIHGFVAQGIAQAAKSNAINNEGDVSLALTELGLNAKLDLYPRLWSSSRCSGVFPVCPTYKHDHPGTQLGLASLNFFSLASTSEFRRTT